MPWQAMVLDVALELSRDGSPAYRNPVVTVPRQQGKTTLLLAVEIHRALMWSAPRQRIYYSAQTGQDGRQKLIDDQAPILERSRFRAAVRQIRKGIGSEGIIFRNGSRIDVMASGEASGHGKVVDLGIIDEAFSDVDDRREQAMTPAQMTKRDAQLWVTSTAGHEGSVYLNRKVDAGRAAVLDDLGTGTCYFEWSADPDADLDDPATWWSCMPALGLTVTEQVVRDARASGMPDGEFRRAFTNVRTVSEERVIPAVLWNAVCSESTAPDGELVFGIDAAPDRSWACIVAVDGQMRAELIERRAGVSWLTARVGELCAKFGAAVAVDMRGPAASVVVDLEARGLRVVHYGPTEMAGACGRLYDAVADAKLSIRRHADLDLAAAGARKRVSGDAWYWARASAHVDISPLVALTLAHDLSLSSSRSGTPWVQWA
ncbi:MAG: terminase large subunit domain-containing protein [Candidatus Dormibacteria bacterium]